MEFKVAYPFLRIYMSRSNKTSNLTQTNLQKKVVYHVRIKTGCAISTSTIQIHSLVLQTINPLKLTTN